MTAHVDQPQAWLSIGYGRAYTRAVLAWPDHRYLPVTFDGASALPSAVHAAPDGTITTGAAAWQAAATAPDGFEPAPARRITSGQITLSDRTIPVVDLVAATLRRVAEQATGLAGAAPTQVHLVVPADWGPRKTTVIRQAAHRAGLPTPTVIPAPVAVAWHLHDTGTPLPVGSHLAVCDFGAGFHASILTRTPTGFELVSTITADPAGGDQVDQLLADHVLTITRTGTPQPDRGPAPDARPAADPDPASGGDPRGDPRADGAWWAVIDSVRVAKDALAGSSTLLVSLPPPHPPVLLHTTDLADPTRQVGHAAAAATRTAIDAADTSPDQLAGVYCVGAASTLPQLVDTFADQLDGIRISPVPEPGYAAVLGAVRVTANTTTPPPPPLPTGPVTRWRRLLAPAVPLVAFGLLLAQLYTTSRKEPGPEGTIIYAYGVVNWGELALAGVFALTFALTATPHLAAALSTASLPTASAPAARLADAGADDADLGGASMGTALLSTAVLGLALAALAAVFGAVLLDLPYTPFLRWALLPATPIAALAIVAGWLTDRQAKTPLAGWGSWLAFPTASIVLAATGMLMIQYVQASLTGAGQAVPHGIVEHTGGLLLGVAAALVLVRVTILRVLAGVLLGLFTGILAAYATSGILAVIYTTAATTWWGVRTWQLARQ